MIFADYVRLVWVTNVPPVDFYFFQGSWCLPAPTVPIRGPAFLRTFQADRCRGWAMTSKPCSVCSELAPPLELNQCHGSIGLARCGQAERLGLSMSGGGRSSPILTDARGSSRAGLMECNLGMLILLCRLSPFHQPSQTHNNFEASPSRWQLLGGLFVSTQQCTLILICARNDPLRCLWRHRPLYFRGLMQLDRACPPPPPL